MKIPKHIKSSSYLSTLLGLIFLSGLLPGEATAGICAAVGLPTPCIDSSDIADGQVTAADIVNDQLGGRKLKAGIALGKPGNDGDLKLKNGTGTKTIIMDGDTGNATQALTGNGFVKAWAEINADGTVLQCYQCNPDPLATNKFLPGRYQVDFSPLSLDITSRPRSATLDDHSNGITSGGISLADRDGVPSAVFVNTIELNGADADKPFTMIIY